MDDRDDLPARLACSDRMMQTFGIELIEARPGACEFQLTVTAEHLNAHGACHGAVLYALADCAFAFSCNAYGKVAVGIDTHMSFATAADPGDRFVLTPEDNDRSEKEISRRYWKDLEGGLLYLVIGLTIFDGFIWALGWIMRGFLGIPCGMDGRPSEAQHGVQLDDPTSGGTAG